MVLKPRFCALRRGFLYLVAHGDAAAAQNALAQVAGESRADVQALAEAFALIAALRHAQLLAERLQFAVLVAAAGKAVAGCGRT